jgi:hypothetical protein
MNRPIGLVSPPLRNPNLNDQGPQSQRQYYTVKLAEKLAASGAA